MKIKIAVMILASTIFAFSCGNDAGQGRVEISISTEDGIEHLQSLVPGSPNNATAPSWLNTLQVLCYSGDPSNGGILLSDENFPSTALIDGQYLTLEVPVGNSIYFIVNAKDSNQIIMYAGSAGPVAIQENSIASLEIAMSRLMSEPVKDLNLTLQLKLAVSPETNFHEQLNRFGSVNESVKLYTHIYTRAVKVGDQWIPANPDDGINYEVGGSYSSSQWTGGQILSNMLQFITVHAEDASGGVIFYGVRVYDHRWEINENPLNIYMYHPSKLVVTLVGSNLPTEATTTIQMYVNGDWRDLYISGTTGTTFNATTTNPVVVDAPSGEGWFTGAPVQTRRVRVVYDGVAWGEQTVEVDWGVSQVTITGP